MTPPLGSTVFLPDGTAGTVLASWNGYYRKLHDGPMDFELVQGERVYVQVVETLAGCGQCSGKRTERYVTLNADQISVVSEPIGSTNGITDAEAA